MYAAWILTTLLIHLAVDRLYSMLRSFLLSLSSLSLLFSSRIVDRITKIVSHQVMSIWLREPDRQTYFIAGTNRTKQRKRQSEKMFISDSRSLTLKMSEFSHSYGNEPPSVWTMQDYLYSLISGNYLYEWKSDTFFREVVPVRKTVVLDGKKKMKKFLRELLFLSLWWSTKIFVVLLHVRRWRVPNINRDRHSLDYWHQAEGKEIGGEHIARQFRKPRGLMLKGKRKKFV